MISTVFLDAGGVLVHPNWNRVADAFATAGLTLDPALLARVEARARFELDQPRSYGPPNDAARARRYFDLVLAHAGVAATEEVLAAGWAAVLRSHLESNLWEVVEPETPAALTRLRSSGRRLVVVSNADGSLRALLGRLGLAGAFEVVIDSREVGFEKPDPAIFETALARSGADRAATVHVGDLYHVDVAGARAAGLRGVLFDPGGLYPEPDCPRVRSLGELADLLEAGPV